MVISEHLNAFVARREQVRKKKKGMQFVNLGMPLVCTCLLKKPLGARRILTKINAFDQNYQLCLPSRFITLEIPGGKTILCGILFMQ